MGELPKKINPKQKDIILLPYPFTDLKETKVRPALVISNDNFNQKSDDAVMLPLTTVLKEIRHHIFITQNDLSYGELIRPSIIRADKIFTVEKKCVITKIGTLKEETFTKVKSELISIF